jgi:hypothetical protein
MKPQVTMDTRYEPHGGYFVGQNQCTCGWTGKQFDIGEIPERKALESEASSHRMVHRVARGFGCVMTLTAITWFGLVLLGLGWLFTTFTGVMA